MSNLKRLLVTSHHVRNGINTNG